MTLTVPIPREKSGKLRFYGTAIAGVVAGTARAMFSGKRLLMTQVKPRGGELDKITALVESGKLRPVIERVFPLEQIAEAHRLSETGHVRGKIVIEIG